MRNNNYNSKEIKLILNLFIKYVDSIRKKWVKLIPEEWVRLNCIEFLINEKKVPRSLISVEKEFKLNTESDNQLNFALKLLNG